MSAVKVSDLFKESTGWYDFFIDFHDYKLCGDLPDIFGRDEELDLADMFHTHLAATEAVQAKWRAAKLQFRRTTDADQPEDDFWLIYAYDLLRDEYLLLTILGPDAHSPVGAGLPAKGAGLPANVHHASIVVVATVFAGKPAPTSVGGAMEVDVDRV